MAVEMTSRHVSVFIDCRAQNGAAVVSKIFRKVSSSAKKANSHWSARNNHKSIDAEALIRPGYLAKTSNSN
jgi:hypothetical protein